jgi:hypothetical protein
MKMIAKLTLLGCLLTASLASADDRHPALDSKYYISVGGYFASRAFKASAEGSVTPSNPTPYVDFESDLKVDDRPDLLVAEFRWQFAEKWNLGLQYFNSTRDGQHTLDETIEWEGVTYEVGAMVTTETSVDVTRIVLSRHFRQKEGHDIRLTGGLHWLDISAKIQGEATQGDGSTAFATSKAAAAFPIPNVGVLYQYSPSQKWLFSARVDWFSASIGDYSGGIWNTNLSVNYQVAEHIGVGLGYQFFQIDGTLTEEQWKGDVKIRFSGPTFQVSAFW